MIEQIHVIARLEQAEQIGAAEYFQPGAAECCIEPLSIFRETKPRRGDPCGTCGLAATAVQPETLPAR